MLGACTCITTTQDGVVNIWFKTSHSAELADFLLLNFLKPYLAINGH